MRLGPLAPGERVPWHEIEWPVGVEEQLFQTRLQSKMAKGKDGHGGFNMFFMVRPFAKLHQGFLDGLP